MICRGSARWLAAGALVAGLLTGCGSRNDTAKQLHPQLLHLRVILQHGTTVDELRKLVEATRLNFETNKADLDSNRRRVIDSALETAEELLNFTNDAGSMTSIELRNDCSDLAHTGAYTTAKACRKEVADYQDLDPTDTSQSTRMFRLLTKKNLLVLELVRARIGDSAVKKMKRAEAVTE